VLGPVLDSLMLDWLLVAEVPLLFELLPVPEPASRRPPSSEASASVASGWSSTPRIALHAVSARAPAIVSVARRITSSP
jgi:hypothetical protein